MLLSDLIISLQSILNKTHHTVNVYLNYYDYISILKQVRKDLNEDDYINIYTQFYIRGNICIKYSPGINNNFCKINSDHYGGIIQVLTKNERMIKNIIE